LNNKTTSALALTALVSASQLFGSVATAQEVNRYNFDQIVKNNNNNNTTARFYQVGDDSALGLFRNDGQGLAMRFPPLDTNSDTDGAILEILDEGSEGRLDPGFEDMEIRVNVRFDPSITANSGPNDPNESEMYDVQNQGMNIVQKGIFDDAQWKLQIDRSGGRQRLGCRFAQPNAPAGSSMEAFPKLIVSGNNPTNDPNIIDLFNGAWRTIRCTRQGDTVTLRVGNAIDSETATDGLPFFETDADVHVGGLINGDELINDQFHGDMDNLIITIDR